MSAGVLGHSPALRVELVPDVRAPGSARRALERLNHGVAPQLVERMKLLVSELVTNSVLHAGLGPRDRIEVAVAVAGHCVRVEVCDPGPGFEPPPRPALDAECGRGLLLVAAVADRWGLAHAERTSVWFEIDRA